MFLSDKNASIKHDSSRIGCPEPWEVGIPGTSLMFPYAKPRLEVTESWQKNDMWTKITGFSKWSMKTADQNPGFGDAENQEQQQNACAWRNSKK